MRELPRQIVAGALSIVVTPLVFIAGHPWIAGLSFGAALAMIFAPDRQDRDDGIDVRRMTIRCPVCSQDIQRGDDNRRLSLQVCDRCRNAS